MKQIAARFDDKNTKKKLDAITENLERLKRFGLMMCDRRDRTTYGQFAEALKAA